MNRSSIRRAAVAAVGLALSLDLLLSTSRASTPPATRRVGNPPEHARPHARQGHTNPSGDQKPPHVRDGKPAAPPNLVPPPVAEAPNTFPIPTTWNGIGVILIPTTWDRAGVLLLSPPDELRILPGSPRPVDR